MAGDVKSSLGTWYPQSSAGHCLSFVLCLRCVLSLCVHWRVTQGQWQDSAPAAPCSATPTSPSPYPLPFLWHPSCPHWLDNTQALYATCPSARLHLGEPLSPSSELPLAAFVWILVKYPPPPPFRLLSSPPALSCSLLLPALSFTNKDTQNDTHMQSSDSFCQLFPASASRHKGATPPPAQAPPPLLPPPTVPACHLCSGCQVLRQERWLLIQGGKIGISLKQMTFNEFQ